MHTTKTDLIITDFKRNAKIVHSVKNLRFFKRNRRCVNSATKNYPSVFKKF